jgi:hypothetical protein
MSKNSGKIAKPVAKLLQDKNFACKIHMLEIHRFIIGRVELIAGDNKY